MIRLHTNLGGLSLCLSLLIYAANAFCQPLNNQIGDVTLPSASAASIGKFGEVPVSYFNGVPSIGVDIYTVTQGPLALPISVNYHSSGIRVAEIASWVGIGWALNAGGMISRSVVGIEDEDANAGWFKISSISGSLQQIADGIQDSEPDVFNFNVAGYSGKFVFDIHAQTSDTTKPMLIPKQDIKITRIMSGYTLNGFKLILPNGIVCYFGSYGGSSARETSEPLPMGGEITTGWYLMRMESHDGKHSITLNYVDEWYSYKYAASAEYYQISQQSSCSVTGSSGVRYLNIYDTEENFNYIKGKRLSSITNSGGTQIINFLTGAIRIDLDANGSNQARLLDKIEIYNGSYSKQFDFSQTYFESTYNSQDKIGLGSAASSWYKRLRLNSIEEKTIGGTSLKNPYTFEYNGTNSSIPHRLSRAVDHWGFANGKITNGPKPVNVPPTLVGQLYYGSSDRDSYESFMLNGVLKKVTYPTLGYTQYTLGANQYFYPIEESNQFGVRNTVQTCSVAPGQLCCEWIPSGGPLTGSTFSLALDEIATAEIDLDLILAYPMSGDCNGGPRTINLTMYKVGSSTSLGTFSFSEPALTPEQPSMRDTLTEYFNVTTAGNYYFQLQSYNAVGKATLYVKQAVEKDVGGLRIEAITHYDKAGTILNSSTYDYTQAGSSTSSGKLYVVPVYGDEVYDGSYYHKIFRDIALVPLAGFDGYHIGYERVLEIKPGHGHTEYLHTVETRIPFNTFPQAPDLFLVKNGQVDKVSVFNQANTLLKSETNEYVVSAYNNLPTQPIKVFYFEHTAGQSTCYYFRVLQYPIRTGYNLLSKKVEYADGMQASTTYSYFISDQLFPTSETTVNSDLASHRTEYSYAGTYPTTPNATIKNKLIEQNRKLPAWKTIKKVDNVKVDGDSTFYSFYDAFGNTTTSSTALLAPNKMYRFEMTWNAAGTAVVDGWKLQKTNTKYNFSLGLPKEVTIDGWADNIKYEWTNSGQLKKWTFIDHVKEYVYHASSDHLQTFIDVDGTTLTYTWDALMRLKDITDCKGVKEALTYDYRHLTDNAKINRVSTATTYPKLGALTNKVLTNTTFLDDLGKPIQTLRYQQHPTTTTSSIAEQLVYNNIGRLTQKHEPKAATHAPTSYAVALTDYTLTTYEPSPLNRPTQIQPPSTGTLGRIQYQYGTNIANEVYDYVHSQYYAAGKLHKTVAIDANGNQTHTFIDIRGRTVLTRRTNGGSTTQDTYTLYDDKDRPVKMLPPGTSPTSQGLIFSYLYHVDDLISEQRTPDHGREEFVYNDRDLLAYRRDSNMRADNHWYATIYDPYGRLDREGFATDTTNANGHNGFNEATINTELIDFTYGTSGIDKDKLKMSTAKLLNGPGSIRSFYDYDGCGRLEKETRNSVPQLNIDTSCVMIYTYDAADNVLTQTVRTPNGTGRLTVVNKNEYDHAGRLIKDKMKVNSYGEKQLSHSEFTVKEQLNKLKLGASSTSPLQTIDFKYKTNRLLTRINDPGALGADLFALRLYYDTIVPGSNVAAKFNGDIANIGWKTPFDTHQQGYAFTYDYLDRLTNARNAEYTGSGFVNVDDFTTTYTYDARSNFDVITRRGINNSAGTSHGLIDNMKYTYPNGNKIGTIDDLTNNAFGFKENTGSYVYDGNGNMTEDPSKACDHFYNHLNKLDSIGGDDGNNIHFVHDALGNLHRKKTVNSEGVSRDRDYFGQVELLNGFVDFIHHANGYINMLYSVDEELTLTGNEPNNNVNYQALKINSSRNTSGNKTITYTAGEIDLLQPFNVVVGSSVTAQIQNFTPSGLAYTYVIRDHLGNNRVFFSDKNNNGAIDTSEVISVHSYYPGGMDFGQKKNSNEEFSYRFGGKEEIEFTKYLSFGARCLDASICRFTTVDRFANKFPGQNPFAYAGSNPLKYIDVNGDSIIPTQALINNDAAYAGFNEFINSNQGQAFAKLFGEGGKYERIPVIFDVLDESEKSDAADNGLTTAYGIDKFTNSETQLVPEQDAKDGARSVLKGNERIKYQIDVSPYSSDATDKIAIANTGLRFLHESQHVLLLNHDMRTKGKLQHGSTVQHQWMRMENYFLYKQRLDFYQKRRPDLTLDVIKRAVNGFSN